MTYANNNREMLNEDDWSDTNADTRKVNEMNVEQIRKIEETLVGEKAEAKMLEHRHSEISGQVYKLMEQILEQLHRAREEELLMELMLTKSNRSANELEEKLHQLTDTYDRLRRERDDAIKEVEDVHSQIKKLESLGEDFKDLQLERDKSVKETEELRVKLQQLTRSTSGPGANGSEFSYLDLMQATNGFSDSSKIGEGGFGIVFKGLLRSTLVAIKMLHRGNMQGQSSFHQEVAVLSRVRHPNLVTLIGSCPDKFALVYEFLPNGSLEDHLNSSSSLLTWEVRTRIITEMRSALIFLHSNKPHPIVHGDLKPDNILLDANLVSKLGDFGICRFLIEANGANNFFRQTQPKGTLLYLDPEFLTTCELTVKSDVYSLGIIILRLLTGKSAKGIAKEVQQAWDGGNVHSIIDKSAGQWPLDLVKNLANLGLMCSQIIRNKRPELEGRAWNALENALSADTNAKGGFGLLKAFERKS